MVLTRRMTDTVLVEDFDPLFIRPCIFPILAPLGYETSISINNGLMESSFSCAMQLSISIFSNEGKIIAKKQLQTIEPGQIVRISADDEMQKLGIHPEENMIGVIHSVPIEFSGQSKVTIDRRFIHQHVAASDDFIEFRQKPKGVITGVAYQMGPQNDYRFNRTRSTLIQAPKIIISKEVDTLFAIINVSTKLDYNETAHLGFRILGQDGELVCQDSLEIQPWGFQLLSVSKILRRHNKLEEFLAQGGRGMFFGLSLDCGLVPISLTRNTSTGAIACDHTLPPVYYFSNWAGQIRKDANDTLKSNFFSQSIKPLIEGD